MGNNHDRKHTMDVQDFFAWQSQTTNVEPFAGDDELAADVDEPPDHRSMSYMKENPAAFQKATIRPQNDRKESLLTRAFSQVTPVETVKPDIRVATDISRRRSTMSIASAASTAELTSDGGITSPARTTTPSPPYPTSTYLSFAPYSIGNKPAAPVEAPVIKLDPKDTSIPHLPATEVTKLETVAEAPPPRKRCISFACGAAKPKQPLQTIPKISPPSITAPKVETQAPPPPKRCPTIKFACPGPKKTETKEAIAVPSANVPAAPKQVQTQTLKVGSSGKPVRHHSRSPSATKKSRPTPPPLVQRDSSSTVRQVSRSPVLTRRSRKPNYIAVDEEALMSSEATRFHEFASDEPQEDDWIRKDSSETKAKLTINDTLKKENAIRQLGEEAEEEALDEEDDDDDDLNDDSDDDNDEEDEEYEEGLEDPEMDDDFDGQSVLVSDDEASNATDGNETDNEAGFADSDDESDGADGIYNFWTPGKSIFATDAGRFRASAQRTASESSIDSLKHMSPVARMKGEIRRPRTRKIKIRPGTPDLPDSTDFVCGTLDEDRPLEDAYVSCMEQRRREKHHIIPQDIDPSFPTSDLENDEEEDNDDVVDGNESETDVWLHGKFEDSDEDTRRRRRSTIRKSPRHSPQRLRSPPPQKRLHSPPPPLRKLHSPPPPKKKLGSPPPPKRLHSPPPPKKRLGSPPPPRRLFGNSPKRTRSPPSIRITKSPPGSLVQGTAAIAFAPLGGNRPDITHTKSLPRTPNAFCRAYRASRLIAANGNIADGIDTVGDGHTRGAIDIVKGLESKRQRRTEKLYQKHCNRARKGQQVDKRPLPGKGAERMRELGLMMAGKTETSKRAEYVLSI